MSIGPSSWAESRPGSVLAPRHIISFQISSPILIFTYTLVCLRHHIPRQGDSDERGRVFAHIQSTMAKCTHISDLSDLNDFSEYIETLRQATNFNNAELEACRTAICLAVYGSGNPDISGIGVRSPHERGLVLRAADYPR